MTPMRLGQFIGPFELGGPLGEGGMAVVYHAWHHRDRTPVAIKVLKPNDLHEVSLDQSFAFEVRAAAQLNHPNVTAVFDHGKLTLAEAGDDPHLVGNPWLAMEKVGGGSIRKLSGKTDWPTIQRILLDVLDALAHAHARGLIHRDIKPGNVLRDDVTGQIKLTDFGLAQSLRHIRSLTSNTEYLTGTPGFMSPEQIRGSRRGQGPWSDIYSVGALGWTLATGRPPYSGELQEVLQAHLRGEMKPFIATCSLPPEFETWLQRAMERNPLDRFLHAADASWALRKLPSVLGDTSDLTLDDDSQIWDRATMLVPNVDAESIDPLSAGAADSPEHPRPVHEFSGARPPIPESWRGGWEPRRHLHGAGLALYGLRSVALVGREQERNMLWSGLRDCQRTGQPRLTLVDGPNGVGKSTLMTWLAERAYELGQAQTLALPADQGADGLGRIGTMLKEHFRIGRLSRDQAVDAVQSSLEHLGDGDRGTAAALVQLARPDEVEPEGSDLRIHFSTTDEQLTLFTWYLTKLAADRPIVLMIEDLHDDSTAQSVVQQLLDAATGAIFCLASSQSLDMADNPNREQVQALRQHARTQAIALKPLPGQDRIALLRELLGLDPSLAAQVEKETGGNPQFAVQLVGHWVDEDLLIAGVKGFILKPGVPIQAPASMLDMWVERLETVCGDTSWEAVGAIELAAVFGNVVEQAAWKRALSLVNLPEPTALIERMARLRLLIVNPAQGTFEFAHAMFRTAITLRSEARGRATHWASTAADALANDKRSVRLRARLLAKAGRFTEALEPLARAVEVEIDTGTRGGAHEIFALREGIVRELDLGPRCLAVFRSEILRWNLLPTRRERTEYIERNFERLNAWAEELDDQHSQSRILRSYAYVYFDQGKMSRGLEILDRALALAEQSEAPTLTLCLYAKAGMQARMGEFDMARSTTRQMLRVAESRGELVRAAQAQYNLSEIALRTSNYDESERILLMVRQRYEAIGSRKGVAHVALSEGELHRARGDLDAAIASYKEAKMRGDNCENSVALDACINMGIVYVSKRRFQQARRTLDGVLAARGKDLQVYTMTAVRMALVSCLIDEGDFERARQELSELDTVFLKTKMVDVDFGTLSALAAQLAQERGDHVLASRSWEVALDQWEKLGQPDKAAAAAAALRGVQ